jgi:hypothetical protein
MNTRPTSTHFETFHHADECIDYITSLENHKVYFIISVALGEIIIPSIYLFTQIITIYVYSSRPHEKERHEEWSKPYKMIVRGVYSDMDLICEQFQKDIFHSTSDLGMKLLANATNPSTTNAISNDHEIDIHHQQEASFMYGQLLKKASNRNAIISKK